ncbi:hypothetical protein [Actinomadura hibisca]|uniref:hypothetical protein n=1 Tax=Actinomadura hibisca TaxID=68565 RepID=UPI000834AD84|nr:hypothetical protein [Actinomadura hibisca]
MGFRARPASMGVLVSSLVQDRLCEIGVKYARIGLMAVHVEEHTSQRLEAMGRCPADRALSVALTEVARAWEAAMRLHGMFQDTIDSVLRLVRMDVEEIADEHLSAVQEHAIRARIAARQAADLDATHTDLEEMLHRARTSGIDPTP